MNCSFTLTAEEFRDVHNGLCDIRFGIKDLADILSKKKLKQLKKGLAQVEKGLKLVYEQDEAASNKNSAHYNAVGEEKNFISIWSIDTVDDLYQQHPFVGAKSVLYLDNYGTGVDNLIPIEGNTWVDLWEAADKAIRQSGDTHHVFIEGLHTPDGDASILVLSTGS